MFRVRILQPTIARLNLLAGDELHAGEWTEELRLLLAQRSRNSEPVAELLSRSDEAEEATVAAPERAVTRRPRRSIGE